MAPIKKDLSDRIDDFIKYVIQRDSNGILNKSTIIRDSLFKAYICNGTDEEKLLILEKILTNGSWQSSMILNSPTTSKKHKKKKKQFTPVSKEDVAANNLSFNMLKWHTFFDKKPSYYRIIINQQQILKELKLNTLDELAQLFTIDMDSLELEHNMYVDALNALILHVPKLYLFMSDLTNKNHFLQISNNKPLNIINLCKFLHISSEKSLTLIKEIEALEQKEKEVAEQTRINTAIELHRKYIKTLKKKQDLTFSEIYPLLANPYTLKALKKESLTLKELLKYFKISSQYSDYEIRKEQIIATYGHKKDTAIHNMHITTILNITPTELKKWKSQEKLTPSEQRSFRKWGQTLYSDFFEAEYLAGITPETIGAWRVEGSLSKNKKLKYFIKQVTPLIKQAQVKGFIYKNTGWYCLCHLSINNHNIKQIVSLKMSKPLNEYKTIESLLKELNTKKGSIDISKEEYKILTKIEQYELTDELKEKILKHLSQHTQPILLKDFALGTISTTMEKHLETFLKIKRQKQIIDELKVEQYEEGYPLARSLNREIKIVTGPTNSGKTYEALQHLMKAKSGVYLAPLRLLAMEIYDKLNAAGVSCNLITGEEKIMIPGANHTSSTVEMMNYNLATEVAVIDEFQMLDDPQRGWAWTAAMVGVPAKIVYVIGNEKKLNIGLELYKHLNEPCEVIQKQRFNTLEHVPQLLELTELKKGDALIAFSRKDILTYATKLRQKGYEVSVIYGALSPEVRRRQAELFSSGQTDIVVSTDAIGMGLNLPIKRVIFATIEKFDGQSVRPLTDEEFLQIAGRAGRYGLHEKGFVGILKNKVNDESTLYHIPYMLASTINSSSEMLKIAPSNWHLQTISKILKTKDLDKILLYFSSLNYVNIYQTANLEHMINLYAFIKKDIKSLSLENQFKLLTAPVELHNANLIYFYKELIRYIVNNTSTNFDPEYYRDLEGLELLNKKLTIYSWLSFHYTNFANEDIPELRENLSDLIEDRLLNEQSHQFTKMIEPVVYQRRERDWEVENDFYDDE